MWGLERGFSGWSGFERESGRRVTPPSRGCGFRRWLEGGGEGLVEEVPEVGARVKGGGEGGVEEDDDGGGERIVLRTLPMVMSAAAPSPHRSVSPAT